MIFSLEIYVGESVKYSPCSPGDDGAIEMNWMKLQTDELLEPSLTINDFLKSLNSSKPSVSEADINRHKQFTDDFGQEG